MKYLLTFKPLKNFFFGNNKTFSDDYLAISEYFPQNTQLLGAIRLFIAEQNKLMHVHKNGKYSNKPDELKKLIGIASSKDFDSNTDLGKIKNLSQMFIITKELDDAYFSTPFDIEVTQDSIKYYELTNIENDYFLKNYNAKEASSPKLGNRNFWKTYLHKDDLQINDLTSYEAVFKPHHQVGIELEHKKVIDKKFYSKTDYQLKNGFLFGCIIELDEKIMNDGIIQIGAESSLFELKIIELESTKLTNHPIISKFFTPLVKGDKVVAISDVMLESTHEFHSNFTIVPYYKNFAMLDNDYSKHKGKTDQKRLIPAGTVSYIKEQVMPHNPSLGAYGKMGYNQFLTVKN
ncbi:MAG: hypothetical protein J0647_05510 [Campylobacteraceae bacterium]|nr:hypothetical protein [Campylobacteraceae bacterium]